MIAARNELNVSTLGDVFFTRVWWTADVERADGRIVLRVRRGARHIAIWQSTLETFDERIEASEQLEVGVGDRFVLCGPSVEETAAAKVVELDGEAAVVDVLYGLLGEATTVVRMTRLGLKSRSKK